MSDLLAFILDHEDAFKSRNRLASLYSDFRYQAQTNPDGYTANINAWRSALIHAARAGLIPSSREASTKNRKTKIEADVNDVLAIRTGEELVGALECREWGRPVALAAVIQDAVQTKEMIPLRDFLDSKTGIYSRRWVPTPWEVVKWSLKQLGLVGGEMSTDQLAVGQFVVVENIEAASNAILLAQAALHQSTTSNIYSLQTFTATFSHIFGSSAPALSSNDITILLTYMSRDKPHLSYSPETSTIKFASPHTSNLPQITDNDISIASIKSLLHTLELAIPPLEERAMDLDAKSREAVAKKQRSTALSLLRSKKLVESTLEKRRKNFLQLEETLSKIEQASDQVEIVQAMKTSTTVLRSLNEQVGGVEGVERVTDALREEMEKGEDISNVLKEPGQTVREEDIDEEFEALMKEERAKEEAIEKAAREKKEREEAEATEKKMKELEKFENERAAERVKQEAEEERVRALASKEREAATHAESGLVKALPLRDTVIQDKEPELEASMEELGKLSLEETRPDLTGEQVHQENSEKQEREKEREMISS